MRTNRKYQIHDENKPTPPAEVGLTPAISSGGWNIDMSVFDHENHQTIVSLSPEGKLIIRGLSHDKSEKLGLQVSDNGFIKVEYQR